MVLVSSLGNVGKVQASNQQWSLVPGTNSLGVAYVITADSNGTLYLADPFEKNIFKLTNGIAENLIGNKNAFGTINSIAAADNGDLFAVEANRVKKYSDGNWADITGTEDFTMLTDITVDSAGNVYVVDNARELVKKLTDDGWDTIGGAGLSTPGGIAVDNSGNVYVADGNYDSIKKLSGDTWIPIFSGHENSAFDISIDSNGELYVLDTAEEKVNKLSGDNWEVYEDVSPVQIPKGFAAFGNGNLYIVDFNYTSVQVLKMTTTSNTPTDAATPVIVTQPQGTVVNLGDPKPVLSVSATISDDGFLEYQWYKNSKNSTVGGVPIRFAEFSSFQAPTSTIGTFYYYAVAKNMNFSVPGNKTVVTTSNVVEVTINGSGPVYTWEDVTRSDNESELYYPSGLTIDSSGNIYVADSWHNQIRKLSQDGWSILGGADEGFYNPLDVAVDKDRNVFAANSSKSEIYKLSDGVWNKINGSTTFANPGGIAVDYDGNVYVADTFNNVIRKWSGESWSDISLQHQTNPEVGRPQGIDVDSTGNVYVVDSQYAKIKKLSEGTWSDITGSANFTPDRSSLQGLAVDNAGNVYVTDSMNNQIWRLSGGTWTDITGTEAFDTPTGVAVDTYGSVYVTDKSHNRIKKLTITENTTPTDAAKPSITAQPQGETVNVNDPSPILSVDASASDGGTLTYQWYKNSENSNSEGTEIEGADEKTYAAETSAAGTTYYYVVVTNTNPNAEGNKTAEVKSEPVGVTVNQPVQLPSYKWVDLTPGTQRVLAAPTDLAIDNDGTVYVASTSENKIRKLTNGVWEDISGKDDEFSNPRGITTDSSGNVYVSDTFHEKIKKLVNGSWTVISGDYIPYYPFGIAVDSNGTIYIAEPMNDKQIKALSNGVATDITGTESFNLPEGIALDSRGNIYVTDTYNNTLKMLSQGVWTSLSEPGELMQPRGVAVDSKGNVYVADNGNKKVKRLSQGVWTDITGTQQLDLPHGIAVDSQDNVYVADNSSDKVKVLYHNAVKPNITMQPVGATVDRDQIFNISVTATVIDGGTLSYQWYSNSEESTSGGTPISEATGSSYTAPTAETGTTYYYVIVKNTNNSAFGNKTAEIISNIVEVSVSAEEFYTVTFNTQGGSAIPGLSEVPPGVMLIAPTPPTKSGYTFQGWYKDAAGTTAWNFSTDMIMNDTTLYAKWTAQSSGGPVVTNPDTTPTPSTSPGTPSGGTSTPAKDEVTVLVGGKEVNGKTTSTLDDERKVTTLTLDEKQLKDVLDTAGPGVLVNIPVSGSPDVFVGELNGEMVKDMESKQAVLDIKTEHATYKLPAQQIDMDSISQQIGSTVALRDIKVHIQIGQPAASLAKAAEDAAGKKGLTLVGSPVEFTVKATHGGKTVEVSKFNAYVERSIALPEGVDPNKITTGVVNDPDGTVRHVPTRVTKISDRYYAQINSLTNSLYSVIWNPLEFKDVEGHWAQTAVNDMGSRLVIDGIGDGLFNPDTNITRAEFAAIMVRGLGLKPVNGTSPFADVRATDWYSSAVQTAYEYNLIEGFGDGDFHPNENITREQAMVIIAKALSMTGLQAKLSVTDADALLSPFVDGKEVSNWAKEGVSTSLQAGITNGRSADALAPKAYITRAEVAALMQRILKQSDLI